MEIKTEYYKELFDIFSHLCPGWAERTSRCIPKSTNAIRVFLENGDYVDFNGRTNTYRYHYAEQMIVSSPDDITDDDCRKEFALKLAEHMRLRGVGQAELSKRTGLSSAAISKYLKKDATPTVTNLKKIAYALDCFPEELI